MVKFGNKMSETIRLSQTRLASFLNCQRQFQLRYLDQVAWPDYPLPDELAAAVQDGHQFHQLIEQHLHGFPVEIKNPTLRQWWTRFKKNRPPLPHGKQLIETTLTIPIQAASATRRTYLLNGRFDLLILGEKDSQSFAHLFDWKTGKPQDEATLRRDWQTRLYLAMLAEGASALESGLLLKPDHIQMTYWYVQAPDQPRTLFYSDSQHAQNWADLQAIIAQLDALDETNVWQLTDELSHCRHCPYQIICNRQSVGLSPPFLPQEDEPHIEEGRLEPQRP